MKYNHIKRFLSAALLLAFTATSSYAYPAYNSGYGSAASKSQAAVSETTPLTGKINLTTANEKISLSLRDSDVRQVLRMFADKAGKNIVFHSSVEGKITLDMVDMPINDAFSLVLQVSGLNYYMQDNTLVIISRGDKDNASFSAQEMMVFPVKYVSAATVAQFLNKNVFGMQKAGISGIEAATVNSATNEVIVFGMPSDAEIVKKVIAQLDKQPESRTFTLSHTTPKEMANMICKMLLPTYGASEEGSSTGGAAGIVTGGAASADGEKSVVLGEGVVACKATMSAKDSTNASTTGFDAQSIAISYYPSRGSIMMIGGSHAQQMMVEDFIKANDIKQRQAYLELSVVELTEEGMKEFQNNWSVQSKNWGVTFNNGVTSGGRAGGYAPEYIAIPTRIAKQEQIGNTNQVGNTTYILGQDYKTRQELIGSAAYISWQMNYLIENSKARVLANPKLLITNGQQSTIDLTEDYVEKVTSEFLSSTSTGSGASGAVQRTYSIGSDKGIKVSLVPFISPDGYVTMNIEPEYATEAGKEYSTNSDGTKDLAATLLNRRKISLKNVRIKDGETLVIAGLIREGEFKTVQKIPFLGDLPLIGPAFRSVSTTKSKSELVVMITPKIINDGDDTVADRL